AHVGDLAAACRVVAVASDPGERAHHVREALEHGAHAFVAWPPAASVAEADALAARAEEAGAEVAVERPLPLAAVVAARPQAWAARLVALDLAGADPTEGLDLPWPRRLAGALDAVMALVRSDAVARLDAQADRDGARLRSVLASLRFRTGAYAHIGVREEAEGWPSSTRLAASGGGTRLSARSLRGPVCVEGASPVPEPPATGLAAFVAALRDGRLPASGAGALALADAVALMRLTERLMTALRG
ncbi:MAG: Gfo/Idh/MocA family oxidoreductase, partial [Bacteroidota bacterium]